MSTRMRTLVAVEQGFPPGSIGQALPGDDELDLLAVVEGLADGRRALEKTAAELVLVACRPDSGDAVELVRLAADGHPDRVVVVLQDGAGTNNGFMHEVFAAGAADIIPFPDTPERIRHALQKAIARSRGARLAQEKTPAPLICVLGPKGGTGKTVTACNLAVLFAEQGHSTAIVDLDLHFGDVGLGLRLSPERTIHDLGRSAGTLDSEKLDGFLLTHPSGVRALLAPIRPDHAGAIGTSLVADVLALLRGTCDMVVVDTPAGFPSEVIRAIDSSTDVCMVGTLDTFSLKDTRLGLETLELMGYDDASVRLVLNRADTEVGISQRDVRAILGRDPDALVPSADEIPRSLTDGNPVVVSAPRSKAARAFRELAALYIDPPAEPDRAEPAARRRKSLLRRA